MDLFFQMFWCIGLRILRLHRDRIQSGELKVLMREHLDNRIITYAWFRIANMFLLHQFVTKQVWHI